MQKLRRRLIPTLAALALAFVAGNQTARFDFDAGLAAPEAPLARATVELGLAGVSVLARYTLGD